MCGIVAIAGVLDAIDAATRAIATLHHRGPDGTNCWHDERAAIALGHSRLSIIDLSTAGSQPMASADGRFVITFNGEIYNYLELRAELADYPFRSHSDTEVILAAWTRWGAACLDRLIGMFAFALWDTREQQLVAVRDRFGVKPLFVAELAGGIAVASEIKALHAAGATPDPDPVAWATFLSTGLIDHSGRTFHRGVQSLPPGCLATWSANRGLSTRAWYELAERVGPELDRRNVNVVRDEYMSLLEDSVRLRFRSDVPVGVNLSGGLDSSTLFGLIQRVRGADSNVKVFTYVTGDPAYDELPWVEEMLRGTRHPLIACSLAASEVPELARRIAIAQDEPFGGLPTLAYAKNFQRAREENVIVLLDGQGMDEQWAGYDYYRTALEGMNAPIVQGSADSPVRPQCLSRELVAMAEAFQPPTPFFDRLRNLQLRDSRFTKIPRALRFNDRVSMASSTELREPFLDHRLFELAFRQPPDRKIHDDTGKWLLRQLTGELLPDRVRLAPKRPVQTPQREWLRGSLRSWADDLIETSLARRAEWFDVDAARLAWRDYQAGQGDNSYWVWQWLSISLGSEPLRGDR
jgi:asparagine synthase (glutamine-hydrolysing)